MDPSALGLVAAKQLGTAMVKRFGTAVVERWTRHRAEAFFNGFLESLGGADRDSVDKKLDEILDDERKSEVLYDAYRSVCFSRSKDIGPRLIGLLTGKLILAGRIATPAEEQAFRASELLSDQEIYLFYKSYREWFHDARREGGDRSKYHYGIPYLEDGLLVVPWKTQRRDSSYSFGGRIDSSPINLNDAFGSWAGALGRIDVITTRVVHDQTRSTTRSANDDLLVRVVDEIRATVHFNEAASVLYGLLEEIFAASEAAYRSSKTSRG